jgi:hypothetical protein
MPQRPTRRRPRSVPNLDKVIGPDLLKAAMLAAAPYPAKTRTKARMRCRADRMKDLDRMVGRARKLGMGVVDPTQSSSSANYDDANDNNENVDMKGIISNYKSAMSKQRLVCPRCCNY